MRPLAATRREGNSSVHPGLIYGPLEKEESLFRNQATSGFVCSRSVVDNQRCAADRKVGRGTSGDINTDVGKMKAVFYNSIFNFRNLPVTNTRC